MKRLIVRVTYDKTYGLGLDPRWKVEFPEGFDHWRQKANALTAARCFCRAWAENGKLMQLVVHGKDGRIQFENTYPRSSDPRRHRG